MKAIVEYIISVIVIGTLVAVLEFIRDIYYSLTSAKRKSIQAKKDL